MKKNDQLEIPNKPIFPLTPIVKKDKGTKDLPLFNQKQVDKNQMDLYKKEK